MHPPKKKKMSKGINEVILSAPIVKFASGLIIIAAMKIASPIILPVLMALFISIICAQPIFWLIKKNVPGWAAILIVLTSLMTILLIFASVIGNSLSSFSQNMPQYEASLNAILASIAQQSSFFNNEVSFDQLIAEVDTHKMLEFTSGILGQVGNLMSDSFVILLVTIFILAEMHTAYLKVTLLEREFGESLDFLNEVGRKIRHYLSLKTVISLITGVLIAIWLQIIGVDYPLLWGVIAFLLNYIPNIGSFLAAIPTMLLALVDLGVGGFMWTGVGYLVVNTVMGSVIEPKLMGRGLGLSTLVVFISLIFWGYIFGGVGMFLSIPITISIKIILEKHPKTRWIAWLLASEEDVEKMLDEPQPVKKGDRLKNILRKGKKS